MDNATLDYQAERRRQGNALFDQVLADEPVILDADTSEVLTAAVLRSARGQRPAEADDIRLVLLRLVEDPALSVKALERLAHAGPISEEGVAEALAVHPNVTSEALMELLARTDKSANALNLGGYTGFRSDLRERLDAAGNVALTAGILAEQLIAAQEVSKSEKRFWTDALMERLHENRSLAELYVTLGRDALKGFDPRSWTRKKPRLTAEDVLEQAELVLAR